MILTKPSRNEISNDTITSALEVVRHRLQIFVAVSQDRLASVRNTLDLLVQRSTAQQSASNPDGRSAKDEGRNGSRRALGAPIRSQFFLSDWRWPLMKWVIPIALFWCLAEVWQGTDGPRVLAISVIGLMLVAGWMTAIQTRATNPSRALAIIDYLYVSSAFALLLTLWTLLATGSWAPAQTLARDLLIWAPLIAGFASFTYARTPGVAVTFTVSVYATLIGATLVLSNHIGGTWQEVPVHSLLAQGAATLLAGVFFSRFRDSVSLTIAKLRIAESHSFQDTLTGLANRRKFDVDWQGQNERGVESSLILLDIDHFKAINDRFGHAVGDEVLSEMAQRIRHATDGAAMAYRWGGEEFAVIVPSTGLHVRTIARQIVDAAASAPFSVVGRVTLSAGTASPNGSETPEAVFQRADSALLSAKALGRNRVCWAGRTPKSSLVFPTNWSSGSIYANRPTATPARPRPPLCAVA